MLTEKVAPKRREGQEERNDGINDIAQKGQCRRCGRALSDPTSIRRGFGPTCYKKFANETERLARLEAEEQLQIQAEKQRTRTGVLKLFAFSCKAGELQEKMRKNRAIIEALLKEYHRNIA